MQDKIDEIMGLVDAYRDTDKKHGSFVYNQTTLDSRNKIKDKLRELVREPLSSEEILNAFKLSVFVDKSQISSFAAGVRYSERAHNIANTSN